MMVAERRRGAAAIFGLGLAALGDDSEAAIGKRAEAVGAALEAGRGAWALDPRSEAPADAARLEAELVAGYYGQQETLVLPVKAGGIEADAVTGRAPP